MKNWTIREMLLLIAILAFVSAYAAEAWRVERLPEDVFQLPYREWDDWVLEIDGNSRPTGSAMSGPGRGFWPNTQNSYCTIETSASNVDKIVETLRRRLQEQMTANGWQWTGKADRGERYECSLSKRDSMYVLRSNYYTKPIPIGQGNKDPDRVRLTMRWMAVGYALSDRGMPLADPPPAVE
jgi:hypothetical protein